MEQELKSAIIGYYRSGASVEQIIGLTGLFYRQVLWVLSNAGLLANYN